MYLIFRLYMNQDILLKSNRLRIFVERVSFNTIAEKDVKNTFPGEIIAFLQREMRRERKHRYERSECYVFSPYSKKTILYYIFYTAMFF